MTAYDRLRKLYETAGPLAIAAPADIAALLDEHAALRAELVRYREWHDKVMAQSFCLTEVGEFVARPQPLEAKP